MTRRFEDPVEVRAATAPGNGEGEVPDSFLWRGRLYVVRAVLGHWRERQAWWNEPFEAERQVWRVEASAGRRAGTGVYDLCRGPVSTWSLLRVTD